MEFVGILDLSMRCRYGHNDSDQDGVDASSSWSSGFTQMESKQMPSLRGCDLLRGPAPRCTSLVPSPRVGSALRSDSRSGTCKGRPSLVDSRDYGCVVWNLENAGLAEAVSLHQVEESHILPSTE
jgi:hypothetical protein